VCDLALDIAFAAWAIITSGLVVAIIITVLHWVWSVATGNIRL